MKSTLDKVRARIVELVPEIVELKAGCQGVTHERVWVMMFNGDWVLRESPYDSHSIIEPREIIGRPIGLEDVLMAMPGLLKVTDCYGRSDGQQVVLPKQMVNEKDEEWWVLNKPLEEQSEETVAFIAQVLGVEAGATRRR